MTKVAETIGAGHIKVDLRDEADREALLSADNPLDWLAARAPLC